MSKLCKDCMHCRPTLNTSLGYMNVYSWLEYDDARCGLTDLVTGSGSCGVKCADEREGGPCGPEGTLFEYGPIEIRKPAKAEPKDAPAKRWWRIFE